MPRYKIESWDPVIIKNSTFPVPMITFKPDKNFMDYAEKNKYQIIAEVEGTGTIYDGKPLVGKIHIININIVFKIEKLTLL